MLDLQPTGGLTDQVSWLGLRHVQTTTDLAGSLPCFNPCGAISSYTVCSGALQLEQKYYLITNSNF